MANPFCYIELNTTDLGPSKPSTPSSSIGSSKRSPARRLHLHQVRQQPHGGMMTHPVPGAPSMGSPTCVDDIKPPPPKQNPSAQKS